MSNYQEKYKKALRSIEEIIKANKQIKDELDALRTMRQAELDSFANIQKEEFRKAYDALLKDKNSLVISLQSLELENEKLKFTVAELEHQVELYRNDRFQKPNDERLTLQSNQQPEGVGNQLASPRKGESKEMAALLRDKQAEFHRTIENYEQHHSNLTRANKRLEERIGELENKSTTTEKNWRIKYEAKELEIIEAKSFARQEFSDQINQLRKENSSLKLSNNDLVQRLESADRSTQFNKNLQSFDWQAELVQEMINVRANLQPLRQQISEMQELSQYEKEQAIRDRTNLQTRVLELEAEVQRQNETIKNMEKKAMDVHREKAGSEDRTAVIKRLEEENQVLNGKIIVMESREIALRNRTGEELEERVLEFENRIELLLSNKEGLRELREIGIHQLLALKAYIMQLDSKLKELLLSNAYLLKKYKGYKQKYQSSLKEQKQLGMTINSLKMKILGYDKLVQKLQGELQRMVKNNEYQLIQIGSKKADESHQDDIYRKKYELMVEKLKIQEKYKEQEIQTLKLNYEARIMDLAIRAEEVKSIKETLQLYRSKNEELQGALSKKQAELFESKVLSGSKVNISEDQSYTRNSKDIIANLHLSLKQNDQTIFRLQTELRNKQDTYKRTITKLQRDLNDLKEEHTREVSKREMEYSITLDQEVKKYKIRISDLEHNHHINSQSSKDEIVKKIQESEAKVRKLEARVSEAETKREEEAFTRRRLEKQIIDLTHDKEQLQRTVNDLQLKIGQFRSLSKQNDDLKSKIAIGSKQQSRDSFSDYELQSKQATIRRLNGQLSELKVALGAGGEKDILISSQKNEIYYLKREVQELNETINKYNNEITFLKGTLDTNKNTYSSQFGGFLEEKEGIINKLRKELTAKDAKIYEVQDEKNTLEEANRKLKRDLTEINRYKQQIDSLQRLISDKDRAIEKYRASESTYEQEYERLKEELTFIKENYQRVNYELLEKNDEISKLSLQINSISIRNRQQLEGRFSQELAEKERQYSRLNSQVVSLKSTLVMTEEDRDYHEQNYKRANTEILNLKGQINQLQDENDSFREQLYFKAQDISKLQYAADNYKADLESKNEEFYRMSTEVFSLKSDVSSLQDEIFTRQAMIARLNNEMGYQRTQYSELEEELDTKQEYLNKLTEEYNRIRSKLQENDHFFEQKDRTTEKLSSDLNSIRSKYRDLEEEMEEREQSFSHLTQQLARFKSNLTFYEQEIDEKNSVIARMNNQKQILKSQIIRLNEVISDKTSEVNRAKQQVFAIKMQAGERDYEQKMRIDQQIYSYKNKITLLEHEVEDKEGEIRRLLIEVEAVRSRPVVPEISEEEVAELRSELMKKQREFVGIRLDIDDYQYQIQTLTNSSNMQKKTIAEYQERLINEREEYELMTKDYKMRERKYQEQISLLQDQNQRKSTLTETKAVSYVTSYSEEEMSNMRQQYKLKQSELNSIKYQIQDKLYIIQTLEAKAKKLEDLVRQMEEQSNQERQAYQSQMQQLRSQQRQQYSKNMQQIQQNYENEIMAMRRQFSLSPATPVQPPVQAAPPAIDPSMDQTQMIRNYIDEIDRLNAIIRELEQDVGEFKLKLSSLVNHENKVEENLITMVELFSELDTVRNRIRNREKEIGDVRKSFMQLEVENSQMNRLLGMVNSRKNINSEEQIESDFNAQKEQIRIEPFRQVQARVEQRNNLEIQRTNQVIVTRSQAQDVVATQANQVVSQNAAPQGSLVRTEERSNNSEVRGSLIQQLQREQDLSSSEVKGGQITIKIQTSNQYVPNQQPVHQVMGQQQKVVQYIGPNGQPVRVIQQVQQIQQVQHAYIPQPGHYQPAFIQTTSPKHSGIHPAAIAQSIGIPRPINYATLPPHSVSANRSLP